MINLRKPILLALVLLWGSMGLHASGTLTERTYKRLVVIQELIGEENYAEALKRLDVLAPSVAKRPYEYATVMQTYGYAYAATSQYKKAISAFEKSLETGALPEGVQHNMLYNVSQLYAAIPDYKKAIGKYEEWFGLAESPNVDSYVYAATIYAQLKNYSKAIEKISKAISMSEKPKERWYQLLLAMYYQQKQYPEAAKTLETMVALFPDNPKYWKQLSGVYFTLKKHRKALVALELAHKRGFLENEKERMNLVNMYLFQDIPYKAAVLLDQELRDGNIPATGDNIEKLGEAWMAAKENDLAIENLLKAADAKSDGRLYLRVAQLLADQEDWPRVLTTIDKAQSTGTLPKPGKALLVKGMALYEQGKYQAAISQFQRGLKYPESKKQAGQWITHINNERELMER